MIGVAIEKSIETSAYNIWSTLGGYQACNKTGGIKYYEICSHMKKL